MIERLFRELVRGQVIFLSVVHGGNAMRVRRKFVEFGCSLVRVIRHGLLPLALYPNTSRSHPTFTAGPQPPPQLLCWPVNARRKGRNTQLVHFPRFPLFSFFLVQAGTDVDRVRRINRAVAFLYVLDLALLVDDKRGAVGKLKLVVQDAVVFRDLPRHVAQKREFDSDFLGERFVGRRSVNTDAQDLGVFQIDLARVDTRLVSLKFFRSTTGEGKNVERQYDVLLAAVIAQLHRLSLVASQGEIRRRVSDLQERVSDLGHGWLLRLGSGQSEKPGKEQSQKEGQDSSCHLSSFLSFRFAKR